MLRLRAKVTDATRMSAEGATSLSPAPRRWVGRDIDPSPALRDGTDSSKDESRIVFDTGLAQQGHELLLEGPLPMMGLLVGDVIGYHLALRVADTEGSVALLPRESLAHFAKHTRGIALEVTDGMRQRHGGRQRDEQMKMIGSASWASRVMRLALAIPEM